VNAYSWTWVALTVTFAATEGTAIANRRWDGTFTDNVRKLFFTRTKLGKNIFGIVWIAFSVWFFGHILELWS